MEKLQNILVPTDFSSNSVNALEYAGNLTKATKSIIHVLHCVEPISAANNSIEEQTIIHEGLIRLEKQMKIFIRNLHDVENEIIEVIRTGKAYEQILNYARDAEIDLIVLAANGWSGSQDLILGTVAEKVTRYSKIPVIIIKNNDLAASPGHRTVNSTLAENWVG